jgi:lipopolysaccharide export system protein LptA
VSRLIALGATLSLSVAGLAVAQQSSSVPAAPIQGSSPNTQGPSQSQAGALGNIDTSSSAGPVEIDASEGIEWRRDESIYIARGNARAARGDLSVSADSLIAHYREATDGKTTIYMVEADGGVVIVSKDARIVGDRAVYDLDKGSAVITGKDLKATSEQGLVTARDSLEYWNNQSAVVARGNARAADKAKGDEVRADLLTGYFRTDSTGTRRLYQVQATGNVQILSGGSIARAAKAVYNYENNMASLDGAVKITRGKNQLNGEHAVYNVKTGQAKVTGGGSQVKTLLVPGSESGSVSGVLKP